MPLHGKRLSVTTPYYRVADGKLIVDHLVDWPKERMKWDTGICDALILGWFFGVASKFHLDIFLAIAGKMGNGCFVGYTGPGSGDAGRWRQNKKEQLFWAALANMRFVCATRKITRKSCLASPRG